VQAVPVTVTVIVSAETAADKPSVMIRTSILRLAMVALIWVHSVIFGAVMIFQV
jgi:hypothetical protein